MAGTIVVDTLNTSTGALSTNNGISGIAKAWVNFTCPSTSVTINNSFNVSSVTRNGTGDYTVSFTTTMPSANYSAVITSGFGSGSRVALRVSSISDMFAGSVRYNTNSSNGVNEDVLYQNLVVFSS